MKVTFVYPDFGGDYPGWRGAYYVGIGSLAGALKATGHDVSLIHVWNPDISKAAFIKELAFHKPDLLAFSSTTNTFPMVQQTAAWVREEKIGIPTIAGGVHVTLEHTGGPSLANLDMICVGEGEQLLIEVCRRLENNISLEDVPGLGYRADGRMRTNEPAPKIKDLDTFPFPDRTIFSYSDLHYEKQGAAMIMASRGCPFNCTYCCNEALRGVLGKSGVVRFHSVGYVIEEAQRILSDYPFIKSFQFDDDVLFMSKNWAREFSERFPKEVGLPFDCNLRPNMAKPETIEMLAAAGCREVKFGLEAGNENMRTQVLGRQLSNEQIIEAVHSCRKAGIRVLTFNMLGLPFETPATALDTIKLNAKAHPNELQYSIFYPFPATKLYQICKENNFLTGKTRYDFFGPSVLDQPTISARQVYFFWYLFTGLVKIYRFIYKLPKPVGRFFEKALDKTLGSRRSALPTLLILAQPINLYRKLKLLINPSPLDKTADRP